MQNKYSKKQLEEDCFFVQASGQDLDELHENIRKKIRNHCWKFGG